MSRRLDPPEFDVSTIKGNAPDAVKTFCEHLLRAFMTHEKTGFADTIGFRTKIVEISVKPNPNASRKEEVTVIFELDVQEDMLNGGGMMHGGCSAYLIDICTSIPLAVLLRSNPGVSHSINMIYHAPAPLGTPLKVVATSLGVGGRTMTARGEIWDTKNDRLVASGVQVKMMPSKPKL